MSKIETTRSGFKVTYSFVNFLAMFEKKKTGTCSPNGSQFQKGDKVTAFGNEGVVKSISSNGMFVEVSFSESQTTVAFTIDGKCHNWNKRPSLVKA